MASSSSSSEFYISSFSSLTISSSSSSMTSSSSSSLSLTSVSTSSDSSSSSIDSSSSSSSSFLDLHDKKYLPFTFKTEKAKGVFDAVFYNETIYVGSAEGKILRKERLWEIFYQTDDFKVSTLFVNGDILWAGTSPNGYVYKIDLKKNEQSSYNVGGNITSIFDFQNKIWLTSNNPSKLWSYNSVYDIWEEEYIPYSHEFNFSLKDSIYVYFPIKNGNLIRFDGEKYELITYSNISKIKNARLLNEINNYNLF
jgi:hypothetical protein